jgi:ubiquinone/menaquinone biosynthesis C-methylase UbiE
MPQNKTYELERAKDLIQNPGLLNIGTPAGQRGTLRRANWIIEASKMGAGKHVLEVGCGTGFLSEIFIRTGAYLHAIDIAEDLVIEASRVCGARADFQACDIEYLPYKDAFFDAVIGVRVLHHLDMDLAFKEIVRTLKKDGVIAFCEPNMVNPQLAVQKNIPFIKRLMGDTPDETAFFRWKLKKFLQERGFADIQVEPFDFLHPWVPKRMIEGVDRFGRFLERIPLIREIAGSLKIYARKA